MKTALYCAFLLVGLASNQLESHWSENENLLLDPIESMDIPNCCGFVTIPENIFCQGIPHPIYSFTFRPANSRVGVTLNPGRNYVQVNAGQNYILSFPGGNGTSCFPVSVNWELCGQSGNGVLQPGGSILVAAGNAGIPCFN
ncbi:MAG: hypothetical protein AAF985_02320 [Bacteroidota bacterium]